MAYLVDTNVALRWTQPSDPGYTLAQSAIATLRQRSEAVFITPQNLIEFWNVATRPAVRNGLGLTPAQADHEAARLEGSSYSRPIAQPFTLSGGAWSWQPMSRVYRSTTPG